jgi:uncharacterized protein (DUF736 family)
MDILVAFMIGLALGAGTVLWYFRGVRAPEAETELETRITALEESMAYALSRFEEVAVTQQKAPKQRVKKQPVESGEDWQRVLDLAREGHDIQSIARQVGKPQGQVELITKLYKG